MHQYIKFTAVMYVEPDGGGGLNWEDAAGYVREGLKHGWKHQEYSLLLGKVTEIGMDEE